MARVAVPTAKASTSDTPDGLVINIPAAKNWFLTLFIGFWMCGWVFGEFFAIQELLSGKMTASGGSVFLVGWLGAWTVAGCAIFSYWMWNVAGHEIISLTPASLSIRRDILGFGRSREYDLPSVKNLRMDRTPKNSSFALNSPSQSIFGGAIAFDYGAKTFRFGGGVDEAEASLLIGLLKSRYPFDSAP